MTRQQGFTILEVLVGFLLAALLLSIILSAFANGLRGLARADRIAQASLVAQSRLAELGHSIELQPGLYEGSDPAGYRWRISVEPLRWDYESQLLTHQRTLYLVNINVRWGDAGSRQGSYDLSSLRLAKHEQVQ